MLVGFGTGVLIGYLLAYWSMSGQTGCPEEPMRRAMETEGISTTSQSYEFSHEVASPSSRVSHNAADKIGGGSTFLTGFGSVYHSRRDCGKLKAAKTVGKFLPCTECGYDKPSMFFEDRVSQPVKSSSSRSSFIDLKRDSGVRFLHLERGCGIV